ncbi:MAG: hypothetical protein A3A97_00980 [Candidatus Terrybacteria bacterium RIFCSPLOWO2_01_FULL_40_23]|uniref:Baseplate protein J-like domain-containing protein n=1 Tax=Candidatus Terrybacteria bacterium RIFCSPLOWO2_01_FULL_40_23 TaxID=1802366 RepID=A0A1G2PSX6_9BACT|nr:MAG: hypothetical protein A3A97_00980 [Candidatus Terrybacteria bacterium RIFCSPLOWO2_01_FULL_40_23]
MITISISQDEELLSVIDKIVTSTQPEIRLVVPNGARILESVENFSLIKREAEAAGKTVSVATGDPRARSFAQAAGLAVFAVSLQSYEENELNYFRPRMSDILPPSASIKHSQPPDQEVAPTTHFIKEPKVQRAPVKLEEIKEEHEILDRKEFFPKTEVTQIKNDEEEKIPVAAKISFRAVVHKLESWPILLVIGGALAAVVVAYALFFSPRAELSIVPRSDDFSSNFTFNVAVNPGAEDIAGQSVEIEKEGVGEVSASGSAVVEDKATGTVKIFNAYSSAPQTLVDTTRLVSQDGKLFRTSATVVIPGATIEDGEIIPSSIDVPVIASEPGSEYNIGPATFSIPGFQGTPKYTKFYGRSSVAMSGGAKGTVKVITAEDVKKAEEAATKDVLAQAEKEFAEKIPDGFLLLDDAKFMNQETLSNQETDDKADSVKAVSKVKIRALLFREEDIHVKINAMLSEQFSAQVEPVADSVKIDYTVPSLDLDKGTMKLAVNVNEKVAWKVDVEDIKQQIAGKSEEEIKKIIGSRSDIASGVVTFRPGWADTAPEDISRITIKLLSN